MGGDRFLRYARAEHVGFEQYAVAGGNERGKSTYEFDGSPYMSACHRIIITEYDGNPGDHGLK